MRRAISFVVALGLFGCGLLLLYLDITSAKGFQGKLALMGGFLIAVGGAWLWADFVRTPTWLARKRYHRGITDCLNTIIMDERKRDWPGLDKAIDLAFKDNWGEEETAVLYAGNLLGRQIEDVRDPQRRQHIGRNVREWLGRPTSEQFDHLMAVAKMIVSGEKTVPADELLQWHIQWALDYVRRLRVGNSIDAETHDTFTKLVCDPLWGGVP